MFLLQRKSPTTANKYQDIPLLFNSPFADLFYYYYWLFDACMHNLTRSFINLLFPPIAYDLISIIIVWRTDCCKFEYISRVHWKHACIDVALDKEKKKDFVVIIELLELLCWKVLHDDDSQIHFNYRGKSTCGMFCTKANNSFYNNIQYRDLLKQFSRPSA